MFDKILVGITSSFQMSRGQHNQQYDSKSVYEQSSFQSFWED